MSDELTVIIASAQRIVDAANEHVSHRNRRHFEVEAATIIRLATHLASQVTKSNDR